MDVEKWIKQAFGWILRSPLKSAGGVFVLFALAYFVVKALSDLNEFLEMWHRVWPFLSHPVTCLVVFLLIVGWLIQQASRDVQRNDTLAAAQAALAAALAGVAELRAEMQSLSERYDALAHQLDDSANENRERATRLAAVYGALPSVRKFKSEADKAFEKAIYEIRVMPNPAPDSMEGDQLRIFQNFCGKWREEIRDAQDAFSDLKGDRVTLFPDLKQAAITDFTAPHEEKLPNQQTREAWRAVCMSQEPVKRVFDVEAARLEGEIENHLQRLKS